MLPWKHYLVNASSEIETLVLDFIQFEIFLCLTRFLPEQSLSLKCQTGRTQRPDANGDNMSLMKLKQNQAQTLVVWVVNPSFFLQIINLPSVVFLLFCCLYSGQFISLSLGDTMVCTSCCHCMKLPVSDRNQRVGLCGINLTSTFLLSIPSLLCLQPATVLH